jgi:hypothetical protein
MNGSQISWEDGNKHLCITPATWSIKNKAERLEAAKKDLIQAGYAADAHLLNDNRLYAAFNKLSVDVKQKYMAMRNAQPAVPRKKNDKAEAANKRDRDERRQGLKFERFGAQRNFAVTIADTDCSAEAQNNLALSKSIGLVGAGQFGAATEPQAPAAEEEGEVERAFKVACITGDEASQDVHTYTEPMCGAVLAEAATYDNKSKDVLIVRVSSAGLECAVGEPVKVDPYTVTIPVTRTNRDDFIHQLLPGASDEKRAQQVTIAEQKIKAAFGDHFDYQVLNNAFNAMVPQRESWTVEVTVNPPFLFGNLKQAVMFKAPNAVDGLVLFPLEKEEPRVEEKAQVVCFDNEQD